MQTLTAGSLVLEPLRAAHAGEMFELLSDPAIYHHLDYAPPPSVEHLQTVYAKLESRHSPDGQEQWLNWVLRDDSGAALGYVQATVSARGEAWIGYVLSSRHWGRGHARTAVQAVLDALEAGAGVTRFLATVEVANTRSIHLLERLGFHAATAPELEGHSLTATERLFLR